MKKEKCIRCEKEIATPREVGEKSLAPQLFIRDGFSLCHECAECVLRAFLRDEEVHLDNHSNVPCAVCGKPNDFSVQSWFHWRGGGYTPNRKPFCSKACYLKWAANAYDHFMDDNENLEEKIAWRGF